MLGSFHFSIQVETIEAANRFRPNRIFPVRSGGFVEVSKSPQVLIVEDEWLVRMEIADAFAELGFDVVESASAEQAAEIVMAAPEIDLLVTDIRLAGVKDGWDLAIEARGAVSEIAVIYLSANPPELERIVHGGVFIDKPALMETVTSAAIQLLRKAQ
jgi:CheY-like chemotaxis protein